MVHIYRIKQKEAVFSLMFFLILCYTPYLMELAAGASFCRISHEELAKNVSFIKKNVKNLPCCMSSRKWISDWDNSKKLHV